MSRLKGKGKLLVWGITLAIVAAIMALVACAPQTTSTAESEDTATTEQATTAESEDSGTAAKAGEPKFEAPTKVPEADEFGVIAPESWADEYPLQYESYLENASNVPGYVGEYAEITAKEPDTTSVGDIKATASDGKANFLETNPEIKVLGKGYGYAKYYTEPGGHTYSIWSIEHNGRLGDVRGGGTKGILACYACKTPQIHFDAENKGGNEAWKLGEATKVAAEHDVALKTNDAGEELPGWKQSATNGADYYTMNISCANCHVNDNPTEMNIIRKDWARVLGDDWESNSQNVPQSGMVCGQCHCDYSMALSETDPEYNNGEPTSPYEGGLDSITPEKALQFYDDHGFVDWTYKSTGAKMLSVRHAEFEFYYAMDGGSQMFKLGYDECADCHMPVKDEDGTAYHSHRWTSPLEDEALVAECDSCHANNGGIVAQVKEWQEDIDKRTSELGKRAADFIHNFEAKVATMQDDPDNEGQQVLTLDEAFAADNGIDADKLAQLQKIQREASYYWNLAAAENSEGAHNRALYDRLIEEGNKLLDEGDAILGTESTAANFDAWNATQAA